MATDTRERLVRVARDLMHARSFAEVSVEDICTHADVRRGSLYHFFASKEALGLAVVELNWELMTGMLERAFATDLPPLERIDRFIAEFAATLSRLRDQLGATPSCPLGALAAELAAHDPQARQRITRIFDSWAGYFTEAVRQAQAEAAVDPELDPATAGVEILGYVQGMALAAKIYDSPSILEQAPAGVRRLLRV